MTPEEETFNKLKEPAPVIDKHGNKCWANEKGQLHRLDGPAVIWANGDQVWWKNGKLHREHGPAVIYVDRPYKTNNSNEYWENGIKII